MKQKMNRRTFLKVSAAAGVTAAVSGFPAVLCSQPQEILIGSVQPATGVIADLGIANRRANQLAVDDINARGGIKSLGGAKLKLLLGDCEAKEEVGRSETERLIKEGVVCVTGPFLSGVAIAMGTLCEARGIPFVIDVAAADAVTQRGFKYTFRCFTTQGTLIKNIGEFLDTIVKEKKASIKRIAVTNAGDLFGRSQGKAFVDFVKAKKLSFDAEIVEHIEYPLGAQDLSAEVAKVKASKPDILCPVARSGDAKLLVRELYKQRVELMGIIGPGSPGWYEPEFIKVMGNLADYVMDNAPWPNPKSSAFREINERFGKLYPGKYLDGNSVYGYLSVLVIADALERAKSTKPEALVEALRTTNYKQEIATGGPVRFTPNGDNLGANTALMQVQKGEVKVVLPKEFAQADYIFPTPPLWKR
jgi:branched-chain amino acid transport system substrate-binding protein